MALKHLKVLKEKKYRLFLVIIIWFIIVFSITSFNPVATVNIILYLPLIVVCLILFTISFVFRKDLTEELNAKMFFKYALVSLIFIVIFSSLALLLSYLILILSILSYIFITSLFTMYGCYNKGIEFDEKLYKWPFPFNWIARSIVLAGGLLVSALLMLVFAGVAVGWALYSEDIANFLAWIPVIMIVLMVILLGIALLFLILGRYNAWLGVFYFWVGIYSIYLMIKAFTRSGGGTSGGTYGLPLPVQIALYVFDLYLVLGTIGSLVGKRADLIAGKLQKIPIVKWFKTDTLIIWLIFSKVAYEFANSIPDLQASALKAILVFVLFVPLFFITGLYGIYSYGKIKQKWKQDKKQKKAEKKRKKLIRKGKIPPEEPTPSRPPAPASKAQPAVIPGIKYCPKCGAQNKAEDQFCRSCGSELKT